MTEASKVTESKMSTESQLAAAALDTLHGARGLPPEKAASELRDFLMSLGSPIPNSARLADASDALNRLIQKLENARVCVRR
jgi:hypothetical protein